MAKKKKKQSKGKSININNNNKKSYYVNGTYIVLVSSDQKKRVLVSSIIRGEKNKWQWKITDFFMCKKIFLISICIKINLTFFKL